MIGLEGLYDYLWALVHIIFFVFLILWIRAKIVNFIAIRRLKVLEQVELLYDVGLNETAIIKHYWTSGREWLTNV